MPALKKQHFRVFCFLLPIAFITACATYYQKNEALMNAVYEGRYEAANKMLGDSSRRRARKDILLYYLNRGSIYWLMQNPEESNKYFRLADYYVEDYQKNYGAAAVSFLSNPKVEPYGGESFEQILLHYYSTLNYLSIGDFDAALVECKRMDQKMQKVTDTYKGKNKYKRDAFVHTLMGIVYDAQHNYNDAFIAYRNAYEVYSDDYAKQLGTQAPVQLKKDLVRTAYLTGFTDDARKYEEEFGINYEAVKKESGDLVLLWNNGLGPVKDEWSINFAIVPAGEGWVNFVNADLGIVFPFYTGKEKDKKNDISGLRIIRVAFPRYITRIPLYTSATLTSDSLHLSAQLELVEPVNVIAYKSLEDRMLKEMGEALLRLAVKQLAESELRKKNEGLGMALSIVNAVSEQADTRNWQLLPYSINYTRISLPAGMNKVKLVTQGLNTKKEKELTYRIRKGATTVASIQNLEFTGYSR